MSLILHIDTAPERASVCLTVDGIVTRLLFNENQKDHAAWLHKAISGLLEEEKCRPRDLDAVSVSIGPGSYTGLRIGLSAAKGLCYALDIPLVTAGSLPLLALAAKEETSGLICPMIDARRMEVYTALYDQSLEEKIPPLALLLDENSFSAQLASTPVLFCGSGIVKFRSLCSSPNAIFSKTTSDASHLATRAVNSFAIGEFADLAYTEPLYIKEFYSPPAPSS